MISKHPKYYLQKGKTILLPVFLLIDYLCLRNKILCLCVTFSPIRWPNIWILTWGSMSSPKPVLLAKTHSAITRNSVRCLSFLQTLLFVFEHLHTIWTCTFCFSGSDGMWMAVWRLWNSPETSVRKVFLLHLWPNSLQELQVSVCLLEQEEAPTWDGPGPRKQRGW